MFAYDKATLVLPLASIPFPIALTGSTYISRQQTVNSKGPPFTLVIGPEHNENVLDANHECQGPDDQ